MRKILALFFVTLSLFSYSQIKRFASDPNMPTRKHNDLKAYQLKGKVKSLKETEYNRVEEYSESPVFLLFNDKGYLAEEIWYQFDGSLIEKIFYQYNEKENEIESILCDEEGMNHTKKIYKYNDDGFETEYSLYIGDVYLGKRSIKYEQEDNDMMKAEINYYTLDGTLEYTKCYYFYPDKLNKMIEDERFKIKYTYDNKGNWIKKTIYNIDHEVASTIIREITYYD